MPHQPASPLIIDRRSFLRLSAVGAGMLGLASTSFALTGCAPGDSAPGAGGRAVVRRRPAQPRARAARSAAAERSSSAEDSG